MAEEPRKRSRFDQTEPPRRSRFDRRSRSPVARSAGGGERRERSPPAAAKSIESPGVEDEAKKDAAARAAAAAARINATIQAKKSVQHVDVPPIRKTSSPANGPGASRSPSHPDGGAPLNPEIYQQDGDFIKDIEVNDLRNRYTLTKGSTQKMIKEKTGADVTTRGNYYPDKSLATAANPPLYLHVTSTTKEGLEKAVVEIEELMKVDLPNLVDERRFRRHGSGPAEGAPGGPHQDRPPFERDHLGRRKWPEEHIPIDLEPIPGFNLRAQVVGSGGSYVKYIQSETGCRVQIKGRGSGFLEHDTGRETDEPMFLHVAGPDPAQVENAKKMCQELLQSVTESYNAFKDRPSRGIGGHGRHGSEERGSYHRDRNSGSYGGGGGGGGGAGAGAGGGQYGVGGYGQGGGYGQSYGAAPSPGIAGSAQAGAAMSPTAAAEQAQQYQAWALYYAQNPDQDPYQQYGGFAAVMATWTAQAQAPAPTATPTGQNGAAAPPPPPPPDSGAAPPPPPPPGSAGAPGAGYNSVPPPPGM